MKSLRDELPRLIPGLAAAYLFGSESRGEARADSDVDVGLLYESPPPPTLEARPFMAAAELASLLRRPVDLVVLNDAPPDLVHRVLRDGVLLLQPNPSARIAFEVRAQPLLRHPALPAALPQERARRVTDPELIAKKLALIETYVRELRTLADPARLESDIREQRFVEHTLQIAIQAALDVASHVASDERLGEPSTNQELFEMLARAGWIDEPLSRSLRAAAGFRNILVHGYATVDPRIVRDVLEHRLDDLLAFVSAIRARA